MTKWPSDQCSTQRKQRCPFLPSILLLACECSCGATVLPSLSHPSPSPEFESSQPGTEISERFFPLMEWCSHVSAAASSSSSPFFTFQNLCDFMIHCGQRMLGRLGAGDVSLPSYAKLGCVRGTAARTSDFCSWLNLSTLFLFSLSFTVFLAMDFARNLCSLPVN